MTEIHQHVVRYHPSAQEQITEAFSGPEYRLVLDEAIPAHEAYRVEWATEPQGTFGDPLDVSEVVETVNEALGTSLEPLEATVEPEESLEEPETAQQPLVTSESLLTVAQEVNLFVPGVIDGVDRMRAMVYRACLKHCRKGEPLTYFCAPNMIPQPDGSVALAFFVTLSIPGPLLGQPMNMGAMVQDLFAPEEGIADLVYQMLEQLRSIKHDQEQQIMASANGVARPGA